MKPNIIIVMTDQQRADLRKACGYPLDTMPFLDQWAQGGVDFRRAYTPNPTCMPARVSMFTGRYPSCHRVRTNHNAQDVLYTQDLLDVLKTQGYRTALCGKNHSHRGNGDFDFARTNGHLGGEGEVNRSAQEQGFSDYLQTTRHMEMYQPAPGGVQVQYPYRNVSDALTFIDETGSDTPFFAWVSFAEPHNPYQVPEPYFDLFPPEALPPVTTTPEDGAEKGHRYPWLRKTWERVLGPDIEQRIRRARSNYHGMLRLIDDQFRRLIEGLEARGLRENTLVVFLSDHGDFVGEYGLIRKGADLPEVLTRIPMVWQGPGIQAMGREDQSCVSLVDILPTLCDLLEVPAPFGSQGKSLLPLLQGRAVPEGEFDVAYAESGFSGLYWRETDALTLPAEGASNAQMETFDCLNTWTQCGQVRMAREGDLKIQVDMQGTGFMYDLKKDPQETRNLWADPAYVTEKAEMLTVLMAATLHAQDPLPAPHHRYRVKQHPLGYRQDAYVSEDVGVLDLPPLRELGIKND